MGFLLALFATTRSQSVQPWRFYDVGLSLINSCGYEEVARVDKKTCRQASFFAQYGITTAQVPRGLRFTAFSRQNRRLDIVSSGDWASEVRRRSPTTSTSWACHITCLTRCSSCRPRSWEMEGLASRRPRPEAVGSVARTRRWSST